jgi:D-3-phosphoglycerate dehydrogenase
VTVVRRHDVPLEGATVVTSERLDEVLPRADAVVLALALTDETAGIIDAARLALLPDHAWLVNVARGEHVVTDDLVAALRAGTIGGAALDVTDPEPLPDGHPLWQFGNVLITPHTANTRAMGRALLRQRVIDNVRRYAAGKPLLGPVDPDLGY